MASRAEHAPAAAPAWVVAGPPGAGKTTVADLLLAALDAAPAAPHLTVGNRLAATTPLADQVAALVRQA